VVKKNFFRIKFYDMKINFSRKNYLIKTLSCSEISGEFRSFINFESFSFGEKISDKKKF